MEPERSLACSQEQATGSYPELTFRNTLVRLRWGVDSLLPNNLVEGPPLVGCPRLLIRHIRSSSIHNLRI